MRVRTVVQEGSRGVPVFQHVLIKPVHERILLASVFIWSQYGAKKNQILHVCELNHTLWHVGMFVNNKLFGNCCYESNPAPNLTTQHHRDFDVWTTMTHYNAVLLSSFSYITQDHGLKTLLVMDYNSSQTLHHNWDWCLTMPHILPMYVWEQHRHTCQE